MDTKYISPSIDFFLIATPSPEEGAPVMELKSIIFENPGGGFEKTFVPLKYRLSITLDVLYEDPEKISAYPSVSVLVKRIPHPTPPSPSCALLWVKRIASAIICASSLKFCPSLKEMTPNTPMPESITKIVTVMRSSATVKALVPLKIGNWKCVIF